MTGVGNVMQKRHKGLDTFGKPMTIAVLENGRTVTMSRQRNPNDLIRIEDAIKVLCRKTCHPGIFCPDIYCKEMWDEFEDVERVEVVRCKDCKHMGDVYLVRLPWLEQKEHRCRYWEHPTMPDDYCSMAEREEE